MRRLRAIVWALALGAAAQAVAPSLAQEAEAPKLTPEQQALMDAWLKAATPGAAHEILAQCVGEWTMTTKSWEDPAKPPTVTTGVSTTKLILGGRFALQEAKSSVMGAPFEGLGLTGYDNLKQKYSTVWIDSMGTAIFFGYGDLDVSGKVLIFTGQVDDPVTGKPMNVRTITRLESPDRHTFHYYGAGPDGKQALLLEITYDRVRSR